MVSILHGFPNTCVARMAVVFFVIKLSINEGSMLKVSESISAKIGTHPSQTIEDVVAIYENGVVMILCI